MQLFQQTKPQPSFLYYLHNIFDAIRYLIPFLLHFQRFLSSGLERIIHFGIDKWSQDGKEPRMILRRTPEADIYSSAFQPIRLRWSPSSFLSEFATFSQDLINIIKNIIYTSSQFIRNHHIKIALQQIIQSQYCKHLSAILKLSDSLNQYLVIFCVSQKNKRVYIMLNLMTYWGLVWFILRFQQIWINKLLLYIFFLMLRQSNSLSKLQTPAFGLHSVLQNYKQSESKRSMMANKLRVLHQQCSQNKKKTKIIQNNLIKINHIKDEYKRSKLQINSVLRNEKENRNEMLSLMKEKHKNSKDNMHFIKEIIMEERHEEYRRLKEKEKMNEMKITVNFNSSLYEKRQRSLEIKLKEQESRLNKTIFLQKKKLSAMKKQNIQKVPFELKVQRNQRQIQQLKTLQSQMVQKLQKSRLNLSRSRLSKQKILGHG